MVACDRKPTADRARSDISASPPVIEELSSPTSQKSPVGVVVDSDPQLLGLRAQAGKVGPSPSRVGVFGSWRQGVASAGEETVARGVPNWQVVTTDEGIDS